MEYERFFAELTPRLEGVRVLAGELDRELAHRFNVFDYLRDDELGLSRIIADLLDPKASHGQGTLFLQTLLSLEGVRHARSWPDIDRLRVRVVEREREIRSGRRLDIFVEIGADEQRYCLAIENKPYAADQKNQIRDYLAWLEEKYPERFLLLYIPPNGTRPSEWSIRETELEKWSDGFAIMPYCEGSEERTDKDPFRIPQSVADWLRECRRNCEVDRLREFLRNFEMFCSKTFGDQEMTTDSERKAASEFILAEPGRLGTALAVSASWPDVKDRVCEKFLKRLCSQIETEVKEKLKEFANDMQVCPTYVGRWSSISLYRDCWAQYEVKRSDSKRRTSIKLQADKDGANGCYIGVCSPMAVDEMAHGDKERRQRLDRELKNKLDRGKKDAWWPWWNWVEDDKRNWNSLVPVLHQENEGGGREVTRYFVNKFTEIAEKALPMIDAIERLS